jgi:predicted DNA-binding protein (UPF0251 family)
MVPRPRICRRVMFEPGVTHFRPIGMGMRGIEPVVLTMEEFESIRLMDHEGLKQTEAAKKMKVSQPTFQRVYESARKKVASALVDGKPIRIEGGHYRFAGPGRGRGMGRGAGRWHGRRGVD